MTKEKISSVKTNSNNKLSPFNDEEKQLLTDSNTPKKIIEKLRFNILRKPKKEQFSLARDSKNKEVLKILSQTRSIPLKIILASNPYSSEDVLLHLAKSQNKAINLKIAANPNITDQLIAKILLKTIDKNRAFQKLGIEPINNQADIMLILTRNPNTQPNTLKLLILNQYNNHSILLAGALNPNTPKEILNVLSKEMDPFIIDNISKNPNTTTITLWNIVKNSKDPFLYDNISKHPNASNDLLKYIFIKYPHAFRLQNIIKHPNASKELQNMILSIDNFAAWAIAKEKATPVHILNTIASTHNKSSLMAKRALSTNYNISPKTLSILAKNSNKSVILKNIAKHPNTPPKTLFYLAQSPDEMIREEVAKNPNTPIIALTTILAFDLNSFVRVDVAKNPHTPIFTLKKLADDSSILVKLALLDNPKLPLSLLIYLKNNNKYFKGMITHLPTSPVDIWDKQRKLKRSRDINTPAKILFKLAQVPEINVRSEVAKNLGTPIIVLTTILAFDPNPIVRANVVLNPNTPSSTLLKLANDPSDLVKNYVLNKIRIAKEN